MTEDERAERDDRDAELLRAIGDMHEPEQLQLTAHELRLLELLSRGLTPEMVASETGSGYESVRSGLKRARTKLGAKNTTHAVAEAIRRKLIH